MSENIKNEEYNPDIVTLSDDEGNEYVFEVLDGIETDEARYLALLPQYSDPQAMLDDSGELVIVKVGEEDGEEYFYEIEDDDEEKSEQSETSKKTNKNDSDSKESDSQTKKETNKKESPLSM